jgi:hypothetical protein
MFGTATGDFEPPMYLYNPAYNVMAVSDLNGNDRPDLIWQNFIQIQ